MMKRVPVGLKDNVYRAAVLASSLELFELYSDLLPLYIPVTPRRRVHQSPRAVAFLNSEGRFRRLFHIEQRRDPTARCLLSELSDKFCSRGSR